MSSAYLINRFASHAAAVAGVSFPGSVFTPYTLYDRTVGATPITETGTVPATPYQIQLPVPASTSGLTVTVGGASRTVVATSPSSGQVRLDRTSGLFTFHSSDTAGSYSIAMTPLATAITDQMFARVQGEIVAVQTYALTATVGPSSATDNAIARFDGTTGKLLQNSSLTTISDAGVITSTVSTGTAPFVVASTTAVANLNASLLLGGTWASPGAAIGTGTPVAATFIATSGIGVTTSATTGKGISATVTGSGGIGGYFNAAAGGTYGIYAVVSGSAFAAYFGGKTAFEVGTADAAIDVLVANSSAHGIYVHDDGALAASSYLIGVRAYYNGTALAVYDSAGTINARLAMTGAVNTGYLYVKDALQIGLGSTGNGLMFGLDGTPGTLKPAALGSARNWTLPDASGTVAVSATTPLSLSAAGALTIQAADSTHNGYLSSTDWTTFNSKGSGTVTAVSVATANGVSGSSSGGATPALTLTLGAITPSSVASSGAVSGTTLTASAQVGCEVYHSTTQSLTGSTDTAILFDSEDSDTGLCHDTSTNKSRLTAPVAGTYIVTASIYVNDDFTDVNFYSWIAKNGAHASTDPRYANTISTSSTGGLGINLSWVITLAANDYLEIYVNPDNTTAAGSATVSLRNRASFKRLY